MGADYTAHALIGVRLPPEKLYRVVKLRSCAHPLPLDAEYCPKCGKPAYQLESEAIYDDNNDLLDGLKVVFGTDREYAIVGLSHCKMGGYGEPGFASLPADLSTIYATIENVLRKRGLWDGLAIGLYSVLDCSY